MWLNDYKKIPGMRDFDPQTSEGMFQQKWERDGIRWWKLYVYGICLTWDFIVMLETKSYVFFSFVLACEKKVLLHIFM